MVALSVENRFSPVNSSPATYYPIYMPPIADTLAERGYNRDEAKLLKGMDKKTKKDYLSTNLLTTINHVFEDSVVSYTNYYQMNKNGEVVSLDGVVLNVDADERGGLNKFGIESAVSAALENPNEVVLLYSPPGQVVFDDNPNNKFRNIKPYIDGQLYMMYSDGEKVHNVAVGISPGGESWVEQIMPYVYKDAPPLTGKKEDEIKRISHFITHPYLTGGSIDKLLDKRWDQQGRIIYKNKDSIEFSLSQTLELVRKSLANEIGRSSLVDDIIQQFDLNSITEEDIDTIYSALAQQYMRERGMTSMTLGGSCGGTRIDALSSGVENLSTNFRLMAQGENIFGALKDHRKDPSLCRCAAASGAHFHCPGVNNKTKEPCNHAIVVGAGTPYCPDCGTGKTC